MNRLHVVRLDFKKSFTIHAGESARGIRLMLKYTKGLDIKNFIKIENKLFETPVKSIADDSVDILFPSLEVGTYQAEIVISENEEILKSGIYTIIVNESIVTGESKKLKSVNADEILMRLSKAEDEFNEKLEQVKKVIHGADGKSAYDIWLDKQEDKTQSIDDFLKSLKGKVPDMAFVIDDAGNVYLDIDEE